MAELGDFICQGRVSAKEVSVEMMDYTYVDKCEDLPELRSILKELKTGTYGRYPHLEGHVEKKILNLLPPKERAKYEALTREPTALDARLAREEVESFSKAQMEDDERLRTEVYVSSKPRASRLPPPRNAKPGGRTEPAPRAPQSYLDESEKKDKKDRISGYDFRSWDTFDVDAECSKVDEADKTKEAARKRAAEDRKRAEEAKARRSLADLKGAADALGVDDLAPAERAFLAAREKHKGNEAYKAGESRDAYDAYTRSLAYDGANAVVFANRAMASIRLGLLERAEDDCTCALKIDPDYAKARQRRGMTRHKRGKYAAAIEDLERACAEDPANEPLRKLLKQSCDKYEDVEGQKAQLKRDAAPAPFVAVAIDDDDDESDDDGAAPAAAKPAFTKIAIADDDESSDDDEVFEAGADGAFDLPESEPPAPATFKGPVKVAIEDDDDSEEDVPIKAAPVKVAIEDDDESEEDVPIKAAPVKVAIEDDDESEEDVPIKAAPVKVAIEDDDDDDEPPALSSTPKVAVDDDDDAQGSSQASPTTSQGSWEDLGKKKEEEKPADADKLKAEGNALMGAGDFAGAVAKYGAALDADAGHYASRANRSLARLKLGDHAGAAADCDACLGHADAADMSKRVKALFRRAEAREGLGLAEAAGSAKRVELLTGAGLDLEAVCKLEPKNDVARNRLRTVSAAMADATDAAAAAATRAAELGAFKESDAKKAAGSEKMKAGDLEGAVADYTAALELWDGNVAARNNRALARLKLEDFDGAVADASAVLVKEPTNLKALYRRGVARRATGDLAGSLDDLDALLVLAPGDRAAAAEKKATRAKLDAKNNVSRVKTKGVVDLSAAAPRPREPKVQAPRAPLVADAPPPPPTAAGDAAAAPPPPPAAATPAAEKARADKAEEKRAAAVRAAAKRNVATAPKKAPKTATELELAWRDVSKDPKLVAAYVATFKPLTLKKIDVSLMSEVFSQLIPALIEHRAPAEAAAILANAAKHKGFAVTRALLSKAEIVAVTLLAAKLDDKDLAKDLAKGYGLGK